MERHHRKGTLNTLQNEVKDSPAKYKGLDFTISIHSQGHSFDILRVFHARKGRDWTPAAPLTCFAIFLCPCPKRWMNCFRWATYHSAMGKHQAAGIIHEMTYWCVSRREWMGCWGNGMIINNYEMDHFLIPDLKHQPVISCPNLCELPGLSLLLLRDCLGSVSACLLLGLEWDSQFMDSVHPQWLIQ